MSTPRKTIKFYKNWNNKLKCQYFTTVRPDWDYYVKGDEYGIMLNGQFQFIGKILSIRRFYLKDLNDYIAYLDAGMDAVDLTAHIKRMYPAKDFTTEKLSFLLIQNINF